MVFLDLDALKKNIRKLIYNKRHSENDNFHVHDCNEREGGN